MASGYLGPWTWGSGQGMQGYWEASQSTSATQSTITSRSIAQERYSYYYGVVAETLITEGSTNRAHKQGTGVLYSNPNATWTNVADTGNNSYTFARGATDKTIYVYAQYYGATVSGYGAIPVSSGGWIQVATFTVPKVNAAPAPSNVVNTRDSDNKNTISWTNNPTTNAHYDSLKIQRSVDGGGYSDLSGATALSATATSYADTTTSANHFYSYRVVSTNVGGTGTSVASNTTYNTPAAPSNLKAARNAANGVDLTWTNSGISQEATEWSRSSDAGANWTAPASITGTTVTSYTDGAAGGGTHRYRVRNRRGTLYSAWSAVSADVVTIMPPKAPTLTAPASGAAISMAAGTVRMAWTHNPEDGSAQTAAQVDISTNGGTSWTTQQLNGATAYFDAPLTWAVNTTVMWRVRTKGADPNYGDYSTSRTFIVRQVPTASITSPANDGEAIVQFPLLLAWNYSDPSGTQQSAALTISTESGALLWQKTIIGTANSYSLESTEFLFDNQASYTVRLTVQSTSTLSSTTTRVFFTDYNEPANPDANLTVDTYAGAVAIQVSAGAGEGSEPETVSMALFRNGILLADGMQSGAVFIDRYPPLDSEIHYTVVALAATLVTSQSTFIARIDSTEYAYINYGVGFTQVLRLGIEPAVQWGSAHDREAITVWGKREPVVRMSEAMTMSGTLSGKVWKDGSIWGGTLNATLADTVALDAWDGIAILRRPHGAVIAAILNVDMATGEDKTLAEVSLSFEKVGADGLYI